MKPISNNPKEQFIVKWIDGHRFPRELPDLRFPEGIDIDCSGGKKACTVPLAHPAKRCGSYYVKCKKCGVNAVISTAGRFDDPRSLTLPCKKGK